MLFFPFVCKRSYVVDMSFKKRGISVRSYDRHVLFNALLSGTLCSLVAFSSRRIMCIVGGVGNGNLT